MKIFDQVIILTAATGVLSAEPSGSFAITDVRVFDGQRTWTGQTVVVREGKIAAMGQNADVPQGCAVVEGAGRTLLPGLIDAHVHAYPKNSLRESEALGVTTVLDMGNTPDVVAQFKKGENSGAGLDGADIYSAGYMATVPGGHGTEYGIPIPTLTTPAQAQGWVDERIAEGSDYIKIILEDGGALGFPIPTFDRVTIDALVAAAHRRNKMAVFHIGTYAEAREAIDAGANGLMHLFIDTSPEPGFGAYVAAHHVFVVPTLGVLTSMTSTNQEGYALAADEQLSDYLAPDDLQNLRRSYFKLFPPKKPMHYEATTETIRQLKEAHASILAGTDAPNAGTMFGASLHGELELLVKAGLTTEEALAAATSKPADCFNLTDRGRIAAGKRADLLLVKGDPTMNIADTRNIVAVWKAGHADDRAAWAVEVAAGKHADAIQTAPADGTISNFEDGTDHSAFGMGWSKSTDSLFGGSSATDYEVVAGGANGTAKALQITGEIKVGFAFPWAGAMFTPGKKPFTPVDLSKHSGIQFWAKGDGNTYRVLYFTTSGGSIPQEATFAAGAEWKRYSFPFSAFGGSDGHDVVAILFCAGSPARKFRFQIDEVALETKSE